MHFSTNDDDKDNDTWLEVWINKSGENEAAYGDVKDVGFPDGSSYDMTLHTKTNPMTWAEIPGSWLQIRIHPNGNDTWKFNVKATLNFAGGGYWIIEANNQTLDQDSSQLNVPLTA